MTSNNRIRAALLVTTALGVAGLASAAFAQTAGAGTAAPPKAANANALEEVVVTATRQTSTVNKVALSVSAVTQKSLDQQGIRNVSDLSNQVPGFTFRVSGGDNNPQLSLRGIGGNAIAGTSGSAPTTGVYVDDIPFQKRNANGLETGSGSPLPLLYDLDRVEVLRGPQGTLYGGSSEGGTIRFITPQPSLTTYSGSARIGVSTIAGGGMGNEEGVALGGPIVQDKLGFRISGFRQDRPGWINAYSELDGHQFASQINKGSDYSLRGSLAWQITPDFKATVSVINQMNYDQDSQTVRTSSPAINLPTKTFINTGTINGVKFSFPQTVLPGYTIPATTWLSNTARNGVVNGLYLTPTNPQYVPSPRRSIFTTPSLSLDYNWHDKLDVKSISSYTSDRTSGVTFTGGFGTRTTDYPNLTAQTCPSGPGLVVGIYTASNACTVAIPYLQFPATSVGAGLPSTNPSGAAGPANVFGNYFYNNRRGQVTEEFRVSTIDPSWRLQFVAGVYIAHEHNHVNVGSSWNEDYWATQLRGSDEAYYAGELPVPVLQVPGAIPVDVSTRNIDIIEDEQSVFGEATFAITSKLKLTAGVRVMNYTQNFYQQYGGAVAGAPDGWVGSSDTGAIETNPLSTTPFPTNYAACPASPTLVTNTTIGKQYALAGCPYQYTTVVLHEHPITPKVGISYQLTSADLLYVTYAEGERPGGINPPAPPIFCATDLANLGVSASPAVYQHDTVKSTEAGGKFRLFEGQAQINASAFHIEWDGVQFVVPLPICAFSYIANAGTAASDGAELQATGRLWGFTVNGNLGYDNARYTQAVKGPVPAPGSGKVQSILANAGDNLGIPDWTANIGVQYDWHVLEMPAYARFDYAYTGKYLRSTTLGTASFNPSVNPNFINGDETHIINLRAGIYWKNLEIAGYVKNAGDSREWINKSQTNGNYYLTGNTVMPRIIGMQMNYRF
jgi:outer membrane receptor protein involved in Fe transport